MQNFASKINIWQEVHAVENLARPAAERKDEKNQASQETWFDLLQSEYDDPSAEKSPAQ